MHITEIVNMREYDVLFMEKCSLTGEIAMPELTRPVDQKRLRVPPTPPPMTEPRSAKHKVRRVIDLDLCPTDPPDKYTIQI